MKGINLILLLGVLMISLVSMVSAGTYPNTDSSTVLYYHFNNNSVIGENNTWIVDSSQYSNNASANNTLFVSSTGPLDDGSMFFNGINSSIIVKNSVMNYSNPYTISFWVKSANDNLSVSNGRAFIGARGTGGTSTNQGMSFQFDNSLNQTYIAVGNDSASRLVYSNSNIFDNNWHNLVGRYDGTNLAVYQDGILINSFAVGFIPDNPNKNFTIGEDSRTAGQYFNGSIDEILVYNRSLSLYEIEKNYYDYRYNFTIQNVSSCGTLTGNYKIFNLINNVTNSTNCIIISNSIFSDFIGNGYRVHFANTSGICSGSQTCTGIRVTGTSIGVTIRDTNIYAYNTLGSETYGIYLATVNHTNIINNTIWVSTKSKGYGIDIAHSSHSQVINNSLKTGGSASCDDCYVTVTQGTSATSDHNYFYNNIMNSSGPTSHAFNLLWTTNTTIRSNTMNMRQTNFLRLDGNSQYGYSQIDIDSSNIVNGKPVNFTSNCVNQNYNGVDFTQYGSVFFANCTGLTIINSNFSYDGLGLSGVKDSNITGNYFNISTGYPMYIMSQSFGNNIEGNRIETIGSQIWGILFAESYDSDYNESGDDTQYNNRIVNNNITTNGTYAYGMNIYRINNSLFSGNIINTYGNFSTGIIGLVNIQNNNFTANTINTYGYNANSLYLYSNSNNNNIYNNLLNATNSFSLAFYNSNYSRISNFLDPFRVIYYTNSINTFVLTKGLIVYPNKTGEIVNGERNLSLGTNGNITIYDNWNLTENIYRDRSIMTMNGTLTIKNIFSNITNSLVVPVIINGSGMNCSLYNSIFLTNITTSSGTGNVSQICNAMITSGYNLTINRGTSKIEFVIEGSNSTGGGTNTTTIIPDSGSGSSSSQIQKLVNSSSQNISISGLTRALIYNNTYSVLASKNIPSNNGQINLTIRGDETVYILNSYYKDERYYRDYDPLSLTEVIGSEKFRKDISSLLIDSINISLIVDLYAPINVYYSPQGISALKQFNITDYTYDGTMSTFNVTIDNGNETNIISQNYLINNYNGNGIIEGNWSEHDLGVNFSTSSGFSGKKGMRVTATRNATLERITKNETTTATIAYIYDSTNTIQLANSTFSGDNANFSYNIISGTTYNIVMDDLGGAYVIPWSSGISYPIVRDDFNYIESADADGKAYGIESIRTANYYNTSNKLISLKNQDDPLYYFSNGSIVTRAGTGLTQDMNLANEDWVYIFSDVSVGELYQTYNARALIDSTQTYSITLASDLSVYNITARLLYNGSYYQGVPSFSGNQVTFSQNILMTYAMLGVQTFNWEITLSNGTTQTFNSSSGAQTVYPQQALIEFKDYFGNEQNASGYYTDGNRTTPFTNMTYLAIPPNNVSIGRVNVYWGWGNNIMNYSQFYDYDNDGTNGLTEIFTLLQAKDINNWFRVVDESGNPIENALIRVSFNYPSLGGSYKEFGQRFTDTQGYTYFYSDSSSTVNIRITKDGYEALQQEMDLNAVSFSYSSPKTFILLKSVDGVHNGATFKVYPNYYIAGNTTTLGMSVYAPQGSEVKYTTSYRLSHGYGNSTTTLNTYKNALITLNAGTDFPSVNSSESIIIHSWIDNEYWGNITINPTTKDTSKFNEPSGINDNFKRGFAWIVLILSVGVLGLFIKGGDEAVGEGRRGKTLLFLGIVLINIVFPLMLGILLLIVALHYGLLFVRKWISE